MEESMKVGMAPMDMGDSRGWEEVGMNTNPVFILLHMLAH